MRYQLLQVGEEPALWLAEGSPCWEFERGAAVGQHWREGLQSDPAPQTAPPAGPEGKHTEIDEMNVLKAEELVIGEVAANK